MRKRLLLSAAALIAIACVVLLVMAMLPERTSVTKANFDRIEKGMTKDQVAQILGGPPNRDWWSEIDGNEVWGRDDGDFVTVQFQDRVVVDKAWIALTDETMFDLVRRWLRLP